MLIGPAGRVYRAKGRAKYPEPDLPNEVRAASGDGRLTRGWWEIDAFTMQWVLDGQPPQALGGDWQTGRAPAMRLKPVDRGQG